MSGPRGQARGGDPPGALRHPRGAPPGPESEPPWDMGVGWGAWGNRGNGAGSAEVRSDHLGVWESNRDVGWRLEVNICPMDKSWEFREHLGC